MLTKIKKRFQAIRIWNAIEKALQLFVDFDLAMYMDSSNEELTELLSAYKHRYFMLFCSDKKVELFIETTSNELKNVINGLVSKE